ncbi:MAG TPA: GNAT family N-acetyltransferase [Rhizomicrobium sp.]
MTIRDAERRDWPAVLALNAASVELLSPMDEARLAKLAVAACYFRVVERSGRVAAFLLAFRKGADYDGEIFGFFDSGAEDFLYIDRVAVDEAARGQGLAGRLYDDICAFARDLKIRRLVCEAYETNATSLRFHARQRFQAFGRHVLAGAGKAVTLLAREIPV